MRRRIVEGAVFVLLSSYLLGYTLPRAWKTLNTDFPNYYLAARLTREGVDPSRAYEWIWLQREKDHRAIDQRVVGLVPITPFSTLAMWPLTGLAPLTAKHVWILFNLALLFPIAWLIRAVSGLSLLRIGCLIGLCFPLHRNLLYGQYYIVLLGILTAACWAVQRQRNRLAGALIALGVAVKIFPVILTLHFIRKKNWAALSACLITGILCALTSISVFGWSLHRTYLRQVLPWTLRGEGLDPYNLNSSSLSTLLHRLFIFEPQLNSHPALHAPWLFAILHPTLQLALLWPALLWIDTRASSPARVSLEWSALLLATLALTPLPASYHFTVLILPVAILCAHLIQERRRTLLSIVIALYLAVGYPGWNTAPVDGWEALLHVKRLYALVLLATAALYLIKNGTRVLQQRWLVAGGAVALTISVLVGLKHQHGLFDDYYYRLPMGQQMLLAAQPVPQGDEIHSIALLPTGYHLTTIDGGSIRISGRDGVRDELSLAAGRDQLWTETVGVHSILEPSTGSSRSIFDAESPAMLADGRGLAFLREIDGRKQLFVRDLDGPQKPDLQLTAAGWNVEEIAISPSGPMIVSATRDKGESRLYAITGVERLCAWGQTLADSSHWNPTSRQIRARYAAFLVPSQGKSLSCGGPLTADLRPLEVIPAGEARYPAISPDGRWLAFSTFRSGYWNLFLRDLSTGGVRRLTTAPCNQTQPAWLTDSKTLLYSSDCGRALGFTAICKRRFLP